MSEQEHQYQEDEEGAPQADPQLEYLQQLVRLMALWPLDGHHLMHACRAA